ncbi:MAG: hypothetical protein V4598_09230 [Bdellovibrionota bacterium]
MNLRDNKSSGELKREVLHELNKVNNDLDSIQGRMTPGQFIDDALFTPVGRNPRVVYDHLIANPIGTAFLSLGTLLLMENDSHVTYESQLRSRSSSAIRQSKDQLDVVKNKVADVNQKLQGAVDRTKEKLDQSREKITGLKDKITGFKETHLTGEYDLQEGGELGATSVSDTLTSKVDTIKNNFEDFTSNASENIDQVKQTVSTKMDTVKNLDPMTFAAIGAGLGALTGISLPVSEKEQTLIDQKLGNQMSTFSSEFQDAINQSVKMLKDELIGKFTNFDIGPFRKNETYRSDSQV